MPTTTLLSSDADNVDAQLELLAQYRRNLMHLMQQAAQQGGESSATLNIINGIEEMRRNIKASKVGLRALGQKINDLPHELSEDNRDARAPFTSPASSVDSLLPLPRSNLIKVDELKQVDRLLSNPKGPRVIVLFGRAGVGKTTVSKVISHQFQTRRTTKRKAPFDRILQFEFPSPDLFEPTLELYIRFLSGFLGIGQRNDLIEQRQLVRESLKQSRFLLTIDDLPKSIANEVFRFIDETPDTVRVLVTQEPRPSANYHPIQMSELSEQKVAEFLVLYCPNKQISDEQVAQIAAATKRNTAALVALTSVINSDGITETMRNLDSLTTEPGREPAEVLIGRTFDRLDEAPRALLCAHVIFKATAHEQALIFMATQHLNVDNPGELRQWIRRLVSDQILFEAPAHGRYRMDNHYYRYLLKKLQDSGELDEWQQRWVSYCCQLRRRRQADGLDDEVGWTIYTDYIRDEQEAVTSIHRDEVDAIVDAIKYCLGSKRAELHWKDAAQLLDDFRAPLFAAGYWSDRLKFCHQVIDLAQRAGALHIVGQFNRLVAWISCFQDRYKEGRDFANEAYDLACENIVRPRHEQLEVAHIVHSQTFYKSLNTMGQLALREGRKNSILGLHALREAEKAQLTVRVSRRKAKMDEATIYLQQATNCFAEARSYFNHARRYVNVVFPPEALIIQFHEAEVDFYDRHSVELLASPDERDQRSRQSLEAAGQKLSVILGRAIERRVDGVHHPHQRLIAHCNYYLGKVERRLAGIEVDNAQRIQRFARARAYLEDAMQLAQYYGDRVLIARIEFAIGQWCESQIDRERNGVEDQHMLNQSRIYVSSAYKALENWGAELERDDVKNFLFGRLNTREVQVTIMDATIGSH